MNALVPINKIHEKDFLFSYHVQHSGLEDGTKYYIDSGREDSRLVMDAFSNLGLSKSCPVLEFAAGYGRMTRFFSLPNFDSCDIHKDAVEFLERELESKSFMSTSRPNDFRAPKKYDFIFAISFFSHIPDKHFSPWLVALTGALNPGGSLLFTTHGEIAASKNKELNAVYDKTSGYGFIAGSEQVDLSVDDYGSSVTGPQYIIRKVYESSYARIVSYIPGLWWGFQDQWVIQAQRR